MFFARYTLCCYIFVSVARKTANSEDERAPWTSVFCRIAENCNHYLYVHIIELERLGLNSLACNLLHSFSTTHRAGQRLSELVLKSWHMEVCAVQLESI